MNPISLLLGKFRRLLSDKGSQRQTIVEVVKRETGARLLPEQLEQRQETIFLKGLSPAVRSQIFLNKSQILEKLKNRGIFLKDLR